MQIHAVTVPTAEDILEHQRADPQLRAVIDYLLKPTSPSPPPEVNELLRDSGKVSLGVSGMLFYTGRAGSRGMTTVPYLAAADRLDVVRASRTYSRACATIFRPAVGITVPLLSKAYQANR